MLAARGGVSTAPRIIAGAAVLLRERWSGAGTAPARTNAASNGRSSPRSSWCSVKAIAGGRGLVLAAAKTCGTDRSSHQGGLRLRRRGRDLI